MLLQLGELVKSKAEDIVARVKTAVHSIVHMYPIGITRKRQNRPDDQDSFSRASYGNDIYTWMALTAFRHFVSEAVVLDNTHRAQDLGFSFVDAIGRGGQAYLNQNNLEEFHQKFPMTSKGVGVLKTKIDEMKESTKELVKVSNLLPMDNKLENDRIRANQL